jgi:hypothetical protein
MTTSATDIVRALDDLRRQVMLTERQDINFSNYKQQMASYKSILFNLVTIVEALANLVASLAPPVSPPPAERVLSEATAKEN